MEIVFRIAQRIFEKIFHILKLFPVNEFQLTLLKSVLNVFRLVYKLAKYLIKKYNLKDIFS